MDSEVDFSDFRTIYGERISKTSFPNAAPLSFFRRPCIIGAGICGLFCLGAALTTGSGAPFGFFAASVVLSLFNWKITKETLPNKTFSGRAVYLDTKPWDGTPANKMESWASNAGIARETAKTGFEAGLVSLGFMAAMGIGAAVLGKLDPFSFLLASCTAPLPTFMQTWSNVKRLKKIERSEWIVTFHPHRETSEERFARAADKQLANLGL